MEPSGASQVRFIDFFFFNFEMTLCYTSHLFRPICLYDFIFGHCVVERLLLVNLVANSMAFCHILLHVDRLLARRQCLVDCSALLLPCNVWNGDVPEGESKSWKYFDNIVARLQTGTLRGTWRQTCWGACEQHCWPEPIEHGWFWGKMELPQESVIWSPNFGQFDPPGRSRQAGALVGRQKWWRLDLGHRLSGARAAVLRRGAVVSDRSERVVGGHQLPSRSNLRPCSRIAGRGTENRPGQWRWRLLQKHVSW